MTVHIFIMFEQLFSNIILVLVLLICLNSIIFIVWIRSIIANTGTLIFWIVYDICRAVSHLFFLLRPIVVKVTRGTLLFVIRTTLTVTSKSTPGTPNMRRAFNYVMNLPAEVERTVVRICSPSPPPDMPPPVLSPIVLSPTLPTLTRRRCGHLTASGKVCLREKEVATATWSCWQHA